MKIMLSDEQKAVVDARAGLVVVDAGAGVGKTTVLANRVKTLIEEGVNPRTIVALSFTRESANTLKERIGDDICSRTLHSLALRVMRVAHRKGFFPDFDLVSEETSVQEARSVIIDIMNQNKIDDLGLDFVYKHTVGDTPAKKKKQLISDGFVVSKKQGRKAEISEKESYLISSIIKIVDLYYMRGVEPNSNYERDLRLSIGLTGRTLVQIGGAFYHAETIPFMEIIKELTRLTESTKTKKDILKVRMGQLCTLASRYYNPEIAQKMFDDEQISHLMVDEVQDIDDGQVAFINALKAKSLFIVGDTNQSLYAFRYVVPNVINRAQELFPDYAKNGFVKLELTINRRCPEKLLVAANTLISRNGETKLLQACDAQKNTSGITVKSFKSYYDYIDGVVGLVRELSQNDPQKLEKTAIIARYYNTLTDIEPALMQRNIPVDIRRDKSFTHEPYARLIILFLSLLSHSDRVDNFHALIRLLNKGLTKEIKFSANAKGKIEEKIDEGVGVPKSLMTLLDNGSYSDETGKLRELSNMFNQFGRMADDDMDVSLLIQYLLNNSLVKEWQVGYGNKYALENDSTNLRTIAQYSYDLEDYVDLLSLQDTVSDSNVKGVKLTTIHSSKGQEWENVILLGFEESVFPTRQMVQFAQNIRAPESPYEVQSTGDLMEERRMAYVALTRAKKDLFLMWTAQRKTPNNKMVELRPSLFFAESGLDSNFNGMTFEGKREKRRARARK